VHATLERGIAHAEHMDGSQVARPQSSARSNHLFRSVTFDQVTVSQRLKRRTVFLTRVALPRTRRSGLRRPLGLRDSYVACP
jgi:hypothetical protein